MPAILDRTHLITCEEEVSFGSPPATRLDMSLAIPTWFSISPITLTVNEAATNIDIDQADGTRMPGRSETVAKILDWSLTTMVHPEIYGHWLKWATGTLLAVNTTNGLYRATLPTPPSVNTLDSFTMYIDVQNSEYFGSGSQVLALLGCTIGRLAIIGTADDAGRKMLLNLEGLAAMPMVSNGATIVVLDYADVDTQDDTITFVVNGVTTTLTEDTDFQSITSNTVAATNITTAINTITGLNATSSGATITVTAQAGYTLQELRTSAKQASLTADLTMADVLQGTAPLQRVRRLLYNSVDPSSYLFSGVSSQWDAGGYLASNNWQSVGIDIINTLIPRKYAGNTQSPYIDAIRLGGQSVTVAVDKDYADFASRLHDFRNATEKALDVRAVHQQDRLANGEKYTQIYTFPRLTIIDGNPIAAAGGGEDERVITMSMRALVDHQVTDKTNTLSGAGDFAMDINTAFVDGSSGDAEAFEFVTTNAGYLTQIRVKLKTTATAANMPETADIYGAIYTDDGGSPSVPSTLVVGGVSEKVTGEILTESYQHVFFTFVNRPKLDAATTYWLVIYTTANGTLTINIETDTGGTNTHAGTHDGGQNWNQPATPDAEDAGYEIYMDDVAAVIENYVKTSATTLYPDPS